jgi:large subunit ribosomal protein L12
MEYAYATLLLNESGEEINERNLKAVLKAAGCTVQESRIKAIVAALEGIDFDDVGTMDLDDIEVNPTELGDRSDGKTENPGRSVIETDDDTDPSTSESSDDEPAVVATTEQSESSTDHAGPLDNEKTQEE